ncbi:hypothetical protein SHKM778_69620 [Streptomyces sp. KM77-8]|uniref:Uncharacterized protein n=1 Tax=Streptomyces haneummycinicus TaxID=3074435 RepID=A0AAT9HSW5_9ACTN
MDRDAREVDEDGLVVAALADTADEVVTGVAYGAVVAHQVAEEDDVDRLLVGEQDGRGVKVDLTGTRAEQAATGAACQPRPMRTAVRLPPSFFCRLMA